MSLVKTPLSSFLFIHLYNAGLQMHLKCVQVIKFNWCVSPLEGNANSSLHRLIIKNWAGM